MSIPHKLTKLQKDALIACVNPWGATGIMYWAKTKEHRRNAAAARRTLLALERMELVYYDEGWRATDKGFTLAEILQKESM